MNGGVSIGDALLYLDQIKAKTSISVYTEFLGIMEQFRSQSISAPCAIERVKTLFKDHESLILGFNQFLPEIYRITPEAKNVEKVHTLNTPIISHIMENSKLIPGSQHHAIKYITTIRNRFNHKPETYRSFLKVLHSYQTGSKGFKRVLEQVISLFSDHPDLVAEFVHFLPAAVQELAKEKLMKSGIATQQDELASDTSLEIQQE